MDFFGQQDRTRRATRRLIVYYIIAMFLVCAAIYSLVWWTGLLIRDVSASEFPFWNSVLMIEVFGAIILFMLLGTFWKVWTLSHGGGARIARLLGGRRVHPSTSDSLERRLLNVVEEISIAAGIPVPDVYILDKQNRVNAFAAGYDANTAVVGITRGALEVLDRNELQGVIAHEFSHIINGDIRLSLRLIGVLFGLQMITMTGLVMIRHILPADGDGSTIWQSQTHIPLIDALCNAVFEMFFFIGFYLFRGIAFIVLTIAGGALAMVGALGMLFGMMIKSLISRQREYLADASSVQFTRDPSAIGGALKKIGCERIDSIVYSDYALEASHLFFGSVLGKYDRWNPFSTHPALIRRIRRIEPTFDGVFPTEVPRNQAIESKADRDYRPSSMPRILTPPQTIPVVDVSILAAAVFPAMPNTSNISTPQPFASPSVSASLSGSYAIRNAAEVVGMIGHVASEQLHIASELLDAIPQELLDAVHQTETAVGVVYTLLLNPTPEHRRAQLDVLAERIEPRIFDFIVQWIDRLVQFSPQSRIPLIQMALPSLRLLSPEDYDTFRKNINRLIKADDRLDLFEYTVQAMMLRPLDVHFGLKSPHRTKYYSIFQVERPLAIVISHLAYAGHDDERSAAEAFQSGTKNLGVPITLLPKKSLSVSDWDSSLKELLLVHPEIKRRILSCFVECVCFDGKITLREGELLRAIFAAMDCPMPSLGSAHNRTDIYGLGDEVGKD